MMDAIAVSQDHVKVRVKVILMIKDFEPKKMIEMDQN